MASRMMRGRVDHHDVPCTHGQMTRPGPLDRIGPELARRLRTAALDLTAPDPTHRRNPA
ncbi:hypothetical protein ABIE67_001475 [Streptomyces sp. V4I8]|uniref:hypothetical protein n=1 Tax=Streptomyces sp. V4I8 TaxID=3156469 RepID=UPI0035167DCB